MEHLITPAGYKSALSIRETEIGIKLVKDYFERALADELNLTRVSAPLFVKPETGLNDNLNGVERPVAFGVKEQNDAIVIICDVNVFLNISLLFCDILLYSSGLVRSFPIPSLSAALFSFATTNPFSPSFMTPGLPPKSETTAGTPILIPSSKARLVASVPNDAFA